MAGTLGFDMRVKAGLHRVRPGGPTPVDAVVAIVVLVGSLALSATVTDARRFAHTGWGALDPWGAALVALSAVPVAAWRRAPMGVFVLTAATSVALAGLDYGPGLPIGPAVALYLLAASRDQATPWTWLATVVVVGLFVAYVAAALTAALTAEAASPGIDVGHTALAWAVAWFAGERTRLRREQLAELRERAAGAERDAERERLLAVAEERARIARDLHDSAGHAINVIVVRAGAARLRHDPERSVAALEAIEELARQTAAEIDQFVGALRVGSPADAVEAPPGLASLDTLVAQHTASGLAVALTTSGVPRPLTGGSDQAAFRILQEALTNAARHGTGAARVELAFGDEGLEVLVTNDIPPGASVRTSGGHGLVGMRERARLLGGALAAEARHEVFQVHARLPYAGAAR